MTKQFVLLFFILFTSCYSAKDFFQYNQLPRNFGEDRKPIFILPSGKDRINKIVLDAFKKNYRGSFSSVSDEKELNNFGYKFEAYIDEYFVPILFSRDVERDRDIQFELTDLETKKVYTTVGFGSAKTKAKYYTQALEILRQKNQQ